MEEELNQEKQTGLVKIVVNQDVKFMYGSEEYDLKRGQIYEVDIEIKNLLLKAGYLDAI